jgi:hypothetical protein
MKVTLDTNCLYDLESNAVHGLRQLVALGGKGCVVIQIPAIAASEKQRDGRHLGDFSIFRERVERLGLGSAELLRPLAYSGMHYIGWAVICGQETRAFEQRIHEIIFPRIAFDAENHCRRDDARGRERWRNAKCDVLAMWCHIKYEGDIFVTRDKRHFLKQSKKSRLEALGARTIATPEQLLGLIKVTRDDDENERSS